MMYYDENAKSIYDKDGLAYVIEIGYIQTVFSDANSAIEYAKSTAKSANCDINVKVIRRIDQYTGEVIVEE